MVFYGQRKVDRIFYGDREIASVFAFSQCVPRLSTEQLAWTPTFQGDEEAVFSPDEHHPMDEIFTGHSGFCLYMSTTPKYNPSSYDRLRFRMDGIVEYPYQEKEPYVIMVGEQLDYANHLDESRLSADQYRDFKFDYGIEGRPGIYDFEILNSLSGYAYQEDDAWYDVLLSLRSTAAGIEGATVDGQPTAWTQLRRDGTWLRYNPIMTELYIGDMSGIKLLGDNAFYRSYGLKNLRVNYQTQFIGARCFKECTALRQADLRNVSMLAQVGDEAFAGCSALEKIVLPRPASISNTAFRNCSALGCIVLLADEPPEVYMESGATDLTFDSMPNDVEICVPQRATDAYRRARFWASYQIRGYNEDDFSWEYMA